jgi:hypothetical protein
VEVERDQQHDLENAFEIQIDLLDNDLSAEVVSLAQLQTAKLQPLLLLLCSLLPSNSTPLLQGTS